MHKFTTSLLLVALVACGIHAQRMPLLSSVPVDVLRNGVLTQGVLNGLGGLAGRSTGGPFGGLLGGLLGGKGVAVSAAYSTSVFVHADIAANIAIDLPTQGGLLDSLTGMVGKVCSTGDVVQRILPTTTVLSIKTKVDVQVIVGVVADVSVSISSHADRL